MILTFNSTYFYELANDILTTPSPSGFTQLVISKIEGYVRDLGLQSFRTTKGNLIVTFNGVNQEKTLGLSAHVDTLGLMVRSINSDGTLNVASIGGNQPMTLQGEYCVVHTRNQLTYTGTILSNAPASHVYEENKTRGQKFEELIIRLDEIVRCKEDVLNLGIENGDYISIDPKTMITKRGFIKSRHIDDKISVALILTLFKSMLESGQKPNYTIQFVVSTYEEVGHGAAHLPENLERLIAVDMGCIGKDLSCTEYDVSICAKDSSGPYDYEMVSELVALSKKHQLNYAVDIYPYYGSDASAALRAGHDVKAALIGPGVHASHGVERTHYEACEQTMKLLYAYLTEVTF